MSWWRTSIGSPLPPLRNGSVCPATRTLSVVHVALVVVTVVSLPLGAVGLMSLGAVSGYQVRATERKAGPGRASSQRARGSGGGLGGAPAWIERRLGREAGGRPPRAREPVAR